MGRGGVVRAGCNELDFKGDGEFDGQANKRTNTRARR